MELNMKSVNILNQFSKDLLEVFLGKKENQNQFILSQNKHHVEFMAKNKTGKVECFMTTLLVNYIHLFLKQENQNRILFGNWYFNTLKFQNQKDISIFYGNVANIIYYLKSSYQIIDNQYSLLIQLETHNELRHILYYPTKINSGLLFTGVLSHDDIENGLNKIKEVSNEKQIKHLKTIMFEQLIFQDIQKNGLGSLLLEFKELMETMLYKMVENRDSSQDRWYGFQYPNYSQEYKDLKEQKFKQIVFKTKTITQLK